MAHDAFVLAAGLGTRLRPLTDHRPKPLVPVCGVPMLSYSLALCARHGLTDVVVNAHHLASQFDAWAGEHEGCEVTISAELPDILGTGGGLAHVKDALADRFAVVNADVLCDVDLTALLALVKEGGASMALRPNAEDAVKYGVVGADNTSTVVLLTDLASAPAASDIARDTHFSGIHAMSRSTLGLVPEGFACIVRTAYRTLVPQRKVRSLRHEGTWLDVGDPAAYLTANLAVLTTTMPVPLDPLSRAAFAITPRGNVGNTPRHVEVEGCVWVGHDARLDRGSYLKDSVVGNGARIRAGARLTRCVVWEGRDVPAGDWTDAIFYDGGYHKVEQK
jgi:NDP-sugar pyrophosphorylase family protein